MTMCFKRHQFFSELNCHIVARASFTMLLLFWLVADLIVGLRFLLICDEY